MRKTEVYQIRISTEEKQRAFAVFEQLGISPAQAIRLFFKQVVHTQSIPFSIQQKQSSSAKPVEEAKDVHTQSLEQQDAELFATLNALLEQK